MVLFVTVLQAFHGIVYGPVNVAVDGASSMEWLNYV